MAEHLPSPNRSPRSRWWLYGAVGVGVVSIIMVASFYGPVSESHLRVEAAPGIAASLPSSGAAAQAAQRNKQTETPTIPAAAPNTPAIVLSEPPLHLMDGYASASSSPAHDIEIVQATLQTFLNAVPLVTRPPLGTNHEFTRALTGDNPLRVAFVPPDDPSIIQGELTDRWGTPLFFHSVSSRDVEIRSAGPDRQMWTSDDVFTPPADHSRYGLNSP